MRSVPLDRVDVAIVGGGFCGAMTAVHLLERATTPLTIALIDAGAAFGRGAAYSTSCPDHLLNVVAAKMSAYEDRPDHFVGWLDAHRDALGYYGAHESVGDEFAPRAAFGRYVRSILEHATAAARNARLTRVVAQIADIEPIATGYRLFVVGAPPFDARAVVLATGNRPPADIPIEASGFYRSDRYVRNPWSQNASMRLERAEEILILGSGLTALDAVMTARRSARLRSIHLLSRRGRLPVPHRRERPYDGDLSDLDALTSVRALVRAVRAHVERAAERGFDWRSVVDALRPSTNAIWRRLDRESKERFLRHVRPHWEYHRHRAAPAVVMEAAALEAAGVLHRHAGRLQTIEEVSGKARATFVERATGKQRTLTVDLVLNCTGPGSDTARNVDSLANRAIERDLILLDATRLGIEHAEGGAVVDAAGNVSDRLFVVGGARRGRLYETTAVPELRKQAEDTAQTVLVALEADDVGQQRSDDAHRDRAAATR